ncbi:MAG: hypothetical protein O9330_14605 [Beijerinckiaceae bacterium]|jgi:hypothetical protein|nr:hypothetical protein [Beijerinckiaceae bacterium]
MAPVSKPIRSAPGALAQQSRQSAGIGFRAALKDDLSRFIDEANAGLFLRYIQTDILFHDDHPVLRPAPLPAVHHLDVMASTAAITSLCASLGLTQSR